MHPYIFMSDTVLRPKIVYVCDVYTAHFSSRHHSILTKALAYFSVHSKTGEKNWRTGKERRRWIKIILWPKEKEHNHEMEKSYKIFIYVENAVKKLLREKKSVSAIRFSRHLLFTCDIHIYIYIYMFTHARWLKILLPSSN